MDVVKSLEDYYLKCCDGDWEHGYGIRIESLNPPGWKVRVNLEDTILEDTYFDNVKFERSDHDWVNCRIEDKFFIGKGGINNLEEIIRIFIDWSNLKSHIETDTNI